MNKDDSASIWSASSSAFGNQSKIADVVSKPWKKPKPAIKIIPDSVDIVGIPPNAIHQNPKQRKGFNGEIIYEEDPIFENGDHSKSQTPNRNSSEDAKKKLFMPASKIYGSNTSMGHNHQDHLHRRQQQQSPATHMFGPRRQSNPNS